MKIAIVTDAWLPQINGVVTTIRATANVLRRRAHEVKLITPEMFRTFPCPTYPEIRLSMLPGKGVGQALEAFEPDCIHICTEAPLGIAARRYCKNNKLRFTTSFHTQLPEYVYLRARIPVAWTYAWMRRFHAAASHTMVNTPAVRRNLEKRGFSNLRTWSRGVDTEVFKPRTGARLLDGEGPIMLYVGRVAVEKNLEAFLNLDHPGTKYVIGSGPDLERLRESYPKTTFLGPILPPKLGEYVASADVFVFPSLTDTFGIVMIEAMACGVPVAAFPVQGPIDVVRNGETGCLDHELSKAIDGALRLNPKTCRDRAMSYSWARCTGQFESNLVDARLQAHVAAS